MDKITNMEVLERMRENVLQRRLHKKKDALIAYTIRQEELLKFRHETREGQRAPNEV